MSYQEQNKRAVIAYDLGTGGVKAVIIDENLNTLAHTYSGYKTFFTPDGQHLQHPEDWFSAVTKATKALLAKLPGIKILAVGISGHSMGAVPVDADGKLLTEYTPIWSDRSARAEADSFFSYTDYTDWYLKTGNGSPPFHYAVFKIVKFKRENPALYEKTACFLGTKDYINLRLCGHSRGSADGFVTDYSYASGSGAFLLKDYKYNGEWLARLGIDPQKLPQILSPESVVGTVSESAASLLGLDVGTPVVCGAVDNGCMALGAGCISDGDVYVSSGTSAWIAAALSSTGCNVNTKPYIFAHAIKNLYLPHAGIFSSGSSHRWVRDLLLPEFKGDAYAEFERLAKCAGIGSDGVMFYPALAGGSGSETSPDIKGGFFGLDLSHSREQIARSCLEGIAFSLYFTALTLFYGRVIPCNAENPLILCGGGAKTEFMIQLYSNAFGVPVIVGKNSEHTAAAGAGALALLGCRLLGKNGFSALKTDGAKVYFPDTESIDEYDALREKYRQLFKLQKDLYETINIRKTY